MPRNRYRFLGNDAPYLMTMTVNHWLAIFTRPQRVEIVLDSWRYLHGGSAQIGVCWGSLQLTPTYGTARALALLHRAGRCGTCGV